MRVFIKLNVHGTQTISTINKCPVHRSKSSSTQQPLLVYVFILPCLFSLFFLHRVQSAQQFHALQAQYSGFNPKFHYSDTQAGESAMAHMGNPEPMMDQQEPTNLTKRTSLIFSWLWVRFSVLASKILLQISCSKYLHLLWLPQLICVVVYKKIIFHAFCCSPSQKERQSSSAQGAQTSQTSKSAQGTKAT